MDINKLAENLQGSCIDFDGIDEGLSQEELELLDSLVRRCECCDWWVETSDVNDDGECSKCVDMENGP